MAKYTILSDVGKGILELLRDKLVPDVIDKSESIGICDAKERGGYIVGLHPYDIKEDTSNVAKEPKTLPDGSVQDPPAMMELYYAISVSSKAEIESKALDEARIMGKIIQVFKDNPTIPKRYLPSNAGTPIENVSVTMLPLNMEEKVKIWTMFGESYKLSVFYVVGPVAIDSENIKKPIKRVEKVYIDSSQHIREREIHFDTFIKDEDIDDEYTQRPDEDEDESEDDSYGSDYGGSGDEFGAEYGDPGDEESGDKSESNYGDLDNESAGDESAADYGAGGDEESGEGESEYGDSGDASESDYGDSSDEESGEGESEYGDSGDEDSGDESESDYGDSGNEESGDEEPSSEE